jgi:hypothetical protein
MGPVGRRATSLIYGPWDPAPRSRLRNRTASRITRRPIPASGFYRPCPWRFCALDSPRSSLDPDDVASRPLAPRWPRRGYRDHCPPPARPLRGNFVRRRRRIVRADFRTGEPVESGVGVSLGWVLFAIFVCGIACGGCIVGRLAPRPPSPARSSPFWFRRSSLPTRHPDYPPEGAMQVSLPRYFSARTDLTCSHATTPSASVSP